MSDFKLITNEEPVHVTNPHPIFLVAPLLVIFFVWLTFLILGCPIWQALDLEQVCPFLISSASLFVSLLLVLDWLSNRFYITNFRVLRVRGIIGKKYTSIWFFKIQDLSVDFGIWGRVFNFGNLLVESAGKLGQVEFRGLPKPLQILDIIEAERKKAHDIWPSIVA